MIDEQTIKCLDADTIFSYNILDDIFDIEDELERTRLIAVYKAQAKKLKLDKELSEVIKAYNAANKKLAEQYARENEEFDTGIQLDYGGDGRVLSTVDNFLKVLERDPHFKGLKFNLLTYSPEQEICGVTEPWTDADDAKTRHYIEKTYHFHNVQKCDDALRIVFVKNQYHPIIDLIEQLKWDGTPRICAFLHEWTGCEDNDYTREVSRLIFAGGIHRLYNNGCKFDDVPVLIGTKQGEGKSTLVRWLALSDEFYTEVTEIEGQKGMESVEGAWICELGELLALTKAREVEAVKSYITRQNDRYRRPFDKRVTDHKRQCIFIGTTNKEQFLTDKTGNRRFYPVKVNQSGYELFERQDEIKAYIRQCWAEARVLFEQGELKPYASRDLADAIRQYQSSAVEDDYRVGMIEEYLEHRHEVCILELWRNALDMGEFSKPTKKDSNEIAMILQSFKGWEKQSKVKRFDRFGPQGWWKKIEDDRGIVEEIENGLPY
ncbi:virulence-associated E family protein [Congzhengia sp.]|uniref:virulence-associated E family protein n=1 Tax=Congzhengia sp. TaxID=2944168 RepID=UPI003078A370